MITLSGTADLLDKHGIEGGFIIGGIAERGLSSNDIDIITDATLPAPFHVITDSEKPQGPAIDVKKLAAVRKFLASFRHMKPVKTPSESHEYYDIKDFKDFKGEYSVEPKYDGYRVAAAKVGPGILMKTDEGRSIEDKLPNIAEELRKIPYDTVILDCELVVYIRGKRGDHSDVAAYLNSKSPAEDYHVKLKPFDIVYADGVDVRDNPLKDRKQLLAKVAWTDHVHPVKYTTARDSGVTPAIMEQATSEGSMVKDMGSTYNTQGKGWYKWKRQLVIDAKVTAVEKKEGGYIYTCEAGGGPIGKTYATKIEAKVGDIIAVSVDHITKKEDGSFTWYAPKVAALRKDKSTPDTAAVLEKMAAGKGEEKEKEKETEGKKMETNIADAGEEGQGAHGKPVLEGDFVLHEHWWGEKHHFDLRFKKTNSEGKAVMIGFTLFANSLEELKARLADGGKLLAKEKEYHTPEWLTFEGEIKPGDAGNPTKDLIAYIKVRDRGHYSFARREADFVDMTLEGKMMKGRFYARKVALKDADDGNGGGAKPGDKQPEGHSEISKNPNNKWLFWKAKEEKEKKVDSIVFADSAGIQIDSSRLVDTKDGLLVKDAIICRAMVLDYQGKKVFKSPEELALSMSSMQRMMITNEHPRARVIMDPSEIKGRILPETVRLDNHTALGDMLITDKALADEVRGGKRDLSPGYFADIAEESGIFNDEPYEAVQKKVLYDHLAVVKKGRCARPVCGILDSIDPDSEIELMKEVPEIPDIPKSALTDSIEKDLGKLHQVAAGLSEKNRELVGRFVESINNLLLTIHRMNWILNEIPEDKRDAMKLIVKSVTKSMAAMSDAIGDGAVQPKSKNDSHSSIIDEDKEKETHEIMTESIVVDGVGYTPETVKKLVADSAALLEAQKKTTETRELLDAKEAKLVETDTALKASEARAAALQAQIDAIEQERRAPLIKQIVDAMPMLKEEDLKAWDMKRLTDTAASIPEADRLRMKAGAGAKPSKSTVDDAYAKVGEK